MGNNRRHDLDEDERAELEEREARRRARHDERKRRRAEAEAIFGPNATDESGDYVLPRRLRRG